MGSPLSRPPHRLAAESVDLLCRRDRRRHLGFHGMHINRGAQQNPGVPCRSGMCERGGGGKQKSGPLALTLPPIPSPGLGERKGIFKFFLKGGTETSHLGLIPTAPGLKFSPHFRKSVESKSQFVFLPHWDFFLILNRSSGTSVDSRRVFPN